MFWILRKYHLIFESADFSFILSAKIEKSFNIVLFFFYFCAELLLIRKSIYA